MATCSTFPHVFYVFFQSYFPHDPPCSLFHFYLSLPDHHCLHFSFVLSLLFPFFHRAPAFSKHRVPVHAHGSVYSAANAAHGFAPFGMSGADAVCYEGKRGKMTRK